MEGRREIVNKSTHMSDKSTLNFMVQLSRTILTDAVTFIGMKMPDECLPSEWDGSAFEKVLQSANRDHDYIVSRANKEGVSFFTKSLPCYGKRLDEALLERAFDLRGFTSPRLGDFTITGKRPLFGWLLARIFDEAGALHPLPCPIAVRLIRQLTYLFYKYELPYSQDEKTKVLSSFISTEEGLPDCDYRYPQSPLLETATNLIANVVHRFSASESIPKHGPGSVATGERQWEKMRFARIYKPLEEHFPFTEWMCPSLNWVCDNIARLEQLKSLDYGTAKVVLVPKDSRGPRLISCEPLEYQWIQQGISSQLVRLIEQHRYTRYRVNFTNQNINRRYARIGSMGYNWVTLDMKDASDCVSVALVSALFSKTHLLQYLLASRSAATKLPDGNIITLKKFAPMGSALCFPVEALCFWALSVASLHHNDGLSLSRAMEYVKVYGDDIITTRESCAAVISTLEGFHLRVNHTKCCTTGSFRESCGLDAYRGVDVTPVKLRKVWSSTPEPSTVISYVELSNEFERRGYYESAELVESMVLKKYPTIPTVSDASPKSYLRFVRPGVLEELRGCPVRYNPVYQRTEIRALVSQAVSHRRKRPGWELLFKALTDLERRKGACKSALPSSPKTGSRNLGSYPVRDQVTLKSRWGHK